MMLFRSPASIEAAIMWVLTHNDGLPMFGLDIAAIVGVGRGSIYTYLARLEERGAIVHEVEGDAHYGRHLYSARLPSLA